MAHAERARFPAPADTPIATSTSPTFGATGRFLRDAPQCA